MHNPITSAINRRLRVAVVGGGSAAQIGATHRLAMRYDDAYEIVAGVFSSDLEQSVIEGQKLGIKRSYPDLKMMIATEANLSDSPDIVAVMTPNDSHADICIRSLHAGYHVICDKPLANTSQEAFAIERLAKEKNKLVCVVQNYSGYPMVRQMKAMVADGQIGKVHQVQVRYAQGNLGQDINLESMPKALEWRLNPQKGGKNNLLLDVGTHAHHLLWFTTGADFESLQADVGPSLSNRTFDDTAMVIGRLSNGARASLIATKAATGAPHILDIEIFGSTGGLSWKQQEPQTLVHWLPGAPSQHYHRGVSKLKEQTISAMRSPRPHPEGFREAFTNIYTDFGVSVVKSLQGEIHCQESKSWADASYAVQSLRFVEACVKSSESQSRLQLIPQSAAV